ncbi:hypothetical protein WN55_08434 [Dufourea novaeangliae]|uniref:Uncharacterized protein n=1 Tax=Dufourea novaeangliae TaxID=178035 RepID=A0A154P720_DUFNO|nr:hypothetical protein WN55_08434 [Dufourea novaeangliae]
MQSKQRRKSRKNNRYNQNPPQVHRSSSTQDLPKLPESPKFHFTSATHCLTGAADKKTRKKGTRITRQPVVLSTFPR